MNVKQRNISEMIHPDCNPRQIRDTDFEQLKQSLDSFDAVEPAVVNTHEGRENVIVGGNQRIRAAKALGWDTFPTVEVDLTPKKERELNIRLNRNTGEWDWDILANEFPEGDLLAWGFEDHDLGGIKPIDLPEDADSARDTDITTEIERGDLITIGPHRMLCGDATDVTDVEYLLCGESVTSTITDSPYGIDYDYDTHQDDTDGWFELMDVVVPTLRNVSDCVVMPCCRIDRLEWWYQNHPPDWLIAWYKGSPGHRAFVGFNDWEPHLVWGKPPGQIHDFFQTACGFERDDHPCPKPVAYATWLVERLGNEGDRIIDPFAGSGTSMVAAHALNRVCFAMEKSPKYCQVIINRMTDLFPDLEVKVTKPEHA